jgi:hypothetical protein
VGNATIANSKIEVKGTQSGNAKETVQNFRSSRHQNRSEQVRVLFANLVGECAEVEVTHNQRVVGWSPARLTTC